MNKTRVSGLTLTVLSNIGGSYVLLSSLNFIVSWIPVVFVTWRYMTSPTDGNPFSTKKKKVG